jgi:hypothetical protein
MLIHAAPLRSLAHFLYSFLPILRQLFSLSVNSSALPIQPIKIPSSRDDCVWSEKRSSSERAQIFHNIPHRFIPFFRKHWHSSTMTTGFSWFQVLLIFFSLGWKKRISLWNFSFTYCVCVCLLSRLTILSMTTNSNSFRSYRLPLRRQSSNILNSNFFLVYFKLLSFQLIPPPLPLIVSVFCYCIIQKASKKSNSLSPSIERNLLFILLDAIDAEFYL